MARCDLCGKACEASRMQQLHREYQVDGIVDLCPECTAWANRTKSRLLKQNTSMLRTLIAFRRTSHDRPRRGWVARLMARWRARR